MTLFAPVNEIGDDTALDCKCGQGWCATHGTDHLPQETEFIADELRVDNLPRNRCGRRVVRKKLGRE